MTYQVLARKWRPQEFDTVVGQEPVTRTIRNALVSGRVAHAYLFTGPRGVGKTTTARLLAKALCCTAREGAEACGTCPSCRDFVAGAPVDVMEIDAASNTGIEDIRTLRENVKYAPARGRFKVYIVDEVHMLSGPAFNAFLKTLEEPPPHVVFILATTDPRKIPATVLSRCQRFDFKPIGPEVLTASLTAILEKEGMPFEPSALPLLVRASEGSLRDALSLLDTAIAYGEGRLDEASVAQLLGASSPVHVRAFLEALIARDGASALEAIDRAAGAGEDLGALCREVVEGARRLLVLKAAPAKNLPELTPAENDALRAMATGIGVDELVYLLRAFLDGDAEMRRSPHPRVELEIAAVRTTRRPEPQALDALLAKVEDALARVRSGGPAIARAGALQESLLGAAPAGSPGVSRPPAGPRGADVSVPAPRVAPAPGSAMASPGTSSSSASAASSLDASSSAGAEAPPGAFSSSAASGPAAARAFAAAPAGAADVRGAFGAAAGVSATPGGLSAAASAPASTGGPSAAAAKAGTARGSSPAPVAGAPTARASAAAAASSTGPAAAPRVGAAVPAVEPEHAEREMTVPSGGLSETWQRVVDELMKKKALLATVLQGATPVSVDGGVLMLNLTGNHFHKEMLADRANRDLINQVIRQWVPGASRFELDAGGASAAAGGARNHPAVQATLNAFQGEVVAVRPRAPEEGESS